MMGSGLKDQESLQINLVGPDGLRNIMAITDSGTFYFVYMFVYLFTYLPI